MLIILLHIFLFIGFGVGYINGQAELKSSKVLYKDQSIIKYWLG